MASRSTLDLKVQEPKVNFLKKISLDFGLVVLMVIALWLSRHMLTPFTRGFFCADPAIRYPKKTELISITSLYLIAVGFPIIFLGMGEVLFANEIDYVNDVSHYVLKWKMHKGFVRTYDILISFGFGFLVCSLVVSITRSALGELRPNFYAVCNPNVNCSDIHDMIYHTNYTCLNNNTREIEYSRMSFPSKHATYCFYSMVYLCVYVHNKVRWDYLSVYNNCMQVAFIVVAWTVAITQLTDYAHHFFDIIAGIFIGSLVAWFNVCAVYNFFKADLRIQSGQP